MYSPNKFFLFCGGKWKANLFKFEDYETIQDLFGILYDDAEIAEIVGSF